MRTIILIILIFSCNILFGQSTVFAKVHAEVIEVLTAYETSEMNFGKFSPQRVGGTMNLSPDGILTPSGTILTIGNHNSASFLLTGENDATFTVNLPNETVILKNQKQDVMKVSDWKSNIGFGKLANGEAIVKVGATLAVNNINVNSTGQYFGTYNITFSYN
jgi:hypothetical protein